MGPKLADKPSFILTAGPMGNMEISMTFLASVAVCVDNVAIN